MIIRIGKRTRLALILAASVMAALPARAMQCVPYARAASGIELRGDAWRWWNAAAGVYDRGHSPRPGAVMVFRKYGRMRLGHVAVVVRVLDAREVLIDHANWGPRGAKRGVSKQVAVRDISPHNDWSRVQVWSRVTHAFGTRNYPTYGFIYPRADTRAVGALFVVELPEEVAALMAAGPTPVRVHDDPLADLTGANDLPAALRAHEPVTAAAMLTAPVATAAPRPMPVAVASESPQQNGVWAGDRLAALRAGSGRY